VRLKCNHGAKYHTVGLAEIAVVGMFHLWQKKVFKTDKHSILIEIKRHSGCSETRMLHWLDVLWASKSDYDIPSMDVLSRHPCSSLNFTSFLKWIHIPPPPSNIWLDYSRPLTVHPFHPSLYIPLPSSFHSSRKIHLCR
jgi:hypothetical protein